MGILSFFNNIWKNTLFYPGCMLKFAMEKELENYKKILIKSDIDFIMIKEEVCCGSPIFNAGYRKDFRNLIEKNYKIFKEKNVSLIITPCPGCYKTFKIETKKVFPKWNIEVEHFTQTFLKILKKGKIKFSLKKEIVSYHDPCHLGRYAGIYEEPREIIKIIGGEIKEAKHNKQNAICCGAGGGLKTNFSETANKIAQKRVSDFPEEAEKIITPCGLCSMHLKKEDKRIVELSEWILERLQ